MWAFGSCFCIFVHLQIQNQQMLGGERRGLLSAYLRFLGD